MTRTEARRELIEVVALNDNLMPVSETSPAKPERRRVDATYCPICQGWVEVRLNPVRLRCTGCGVEARP